ncbi:MAG: uroporphyrinogen decarboxylase family protein [Treponema sp.]|nr:uroporphyrinogen decarboxylase family protein [Treponema sp.]
MEPRERVLAALRHENTDKVPFSTGFGVNEYARKQLAEYLGMTQAELEQKITETRDIRFVYPQYKGPSYRFPGRDASRPDIWGVGRKPVFNGFDNYWEICKYPLAGLGEKISLEDHEFPSVDWFDFSVLKQRISETNSKNEYAIAAGNGNIFETSWYMTGFENMLTLLYTEPEIVNRLLEKVADYYIAFFERAMEASGGGIDIVFTADDIGQQNGLMMSLPMWEKFLKPHHARLNRRLHAAGAKIMYHTDGAVMDAVEGLVDMGIDILEALQFSARGMDPVLLKKNWGSRLCFHGGISVQSTLPFGTADDVRREVRERIEILGKNGGYILAPSHAIQGGTPPQNIAAFFEEAGRPLK